MKVILIDQFSSNKKLKNQNFFGNILTPILNKPLLVHQIEMLRNCGIEDILVLTEQVLPSDLTDGKRWNIKLEIRNLLRISELNKEAVQSDFFFLPANILTNLDYGEFIKYHKYHQSEFSVAESTHLNIPGYAEYFNPVVMKHSKMRKLIGEQKETDPSISVQWINQNSKAAMKIKVNYEYTFLKSYNDYWDLQKKMIQSDPDMAALPGFPVTQNLWIDVGSRVQPETKVEGIAIIGKNSKIYGDVSLKGFVIIGDNVIIDSRSQIENSIILKNSYIGSDITVKNAVANKNFLFQVDYNVGVEITDNFIMGESGKFSGYRHLKKWKKKLTGSN